VHIPACTHRANDSDHSSCRFKGFWSENTQDTQL
jgi:hypothetical protein